MQLLTVILKVTLVMKIAYYMPFKAMGHKNPSGDLVIGTELFSYLVRNGAEVELVSKFRCRWIYLKPHLWPLLIVELLRVLSHCRKNRPDLWVSYHSYYKAPDVVGALCCRLLGIPYVIFQGIYSTKRRRSLKTLVGFHLNRLALLSTQCVFTNKKPDEKNLRRLLDPDKIIYVPPGLHPEEFQFDGLSRKQLRSQWQIENSLVVFTAAMFRPGVKTDGIIRVIESCKSLKAKGKDIFLVVAGDGVNREILQELAENQLGSACLFLGKIKRSQMKNYYSAADIFAFPGIEESLGMVFLEAQSCGLPIVAYQDWGASEAVVDKSTGLLSAAAEEQQFTRNLGRLIDDSLRRQSMGERAADHVRVRHDIEKNYGLVLEKLHRIIQANITA